MIFIIFGVEKYTNNKNEIQNVTTTFSRQKVSAVLFTAAIFSSFQL